MLISGVFKYVKYAFVFCVRWYTVESPKLFQLNIVAVPVR